MKLFYDWDEFESATASVKIAFDDFDSLKIEHKLTQDELIKHVEKLSQASDWVFIIETEMYYHEYILLSSPDYIPPDNVKWLMPGTILGREQHIIDWQYHLWRLDNLYRIENKGYLECQRYHGWLRDHLQRLDTPAEKKYVFDALLGTPRESRVWFRDQINGSPCRSQIMLRILPSLRNESGLPVSEDVFHVEPEWQMNQEFYVAPTTSGVSYGSVDSIVPSNIIPITAHQQCYFSIISETGCENHTHMVTEKTAKALLAQRLFLPIAGRGFMRYLRNLGFQTFGDVIDESYDDIENNHERWSALIAEVERICSSDYQEIARRSQPILQHNQEIMLTRDFVQPPLTEIERLIDTLVYK
jgi:hypothetical protein